MEVGKKKVAFASDHDGIMRDAGLITSFLSLRVDLARW